MERSNLLPRRELASFAKGVLAMTMDEMFMAFVIPKGTP